MVKVKPWSSFERIGSTRVPSFKVIGLLVPKKKHRVINWTDLVVLGYQRLHTNLQGHQPVGSEEEYF